MRELTGVELTGCKVLDIGPGQLLRHMRCLAVSNEVLGIDMDIIPQRLTDYARLLVYSPPTRVLKTLGRKLIGKDARFRKALYRELGGREASSLPVLRMSASNMQFEDDRFDFVCSYSVFEHIDSPAAALREVCRVLRPGGVAYLSVHVYTCNSGAHDLRTMRGQPSPPYWAHLRRERAASVRPSAYLNRLTCSEWQALFAELMPGATLLRERSEEPELHAALRELRAQGELLDYADDDLLTVNLVAVWKKPDSSSEQRPASPGSTAPRASVHAHSRIEPTAAPSQLRFSVAGSSSRPEPEASVN